MLVEAPEPCPAMPTPTPFMLGEEDREEGPCPLLASSAGPSRMASKRRLRVSLPDDCLLRVAGASTNRLVLPGGPGPSYTQHSALFKNTLGAELWVRHPIQAL